MMKVKVANLSNSNVYYIKGEMFRCVSAGLDNGMYDFALYPVSNPTNSRSNPLWLDKVYKRRDEEGHVVTNEFRYRVVGSNSKFKYWLNKQDIKLVISL